MSAHKAVFATMGTMASLTVASHVDEFTAAAAGRVCRESLDADDHRFSHFTTDSDIVRWLEGQDVGREAELEITHILNACMLLEVSSNGVFRATNPQTGRLDTAGYVKGYSIRKAVGRIRDLGVNDFTLNLGGDSYSSGRPSPDRPWRIAIVDPVESRRIAAIVEASDRAVATSGDAERGPHIWAGEEMVASDLRSFTVVGPDIAAADAYATIGFAMGLDGVDWVSAHTEYSSFFVRTDGTTGGDAALVSVM